MKTTIVLALLALFACATYVEAQEKIPKFCRTSSYTLPCTVIDRQKKSLFKTCGWQPLKITINKSLLNGKCCNYVQQTTNKASWDKFSACQREQEAYRILKLNIRDCPEAQKNSLC